MRIRPPLTATHNLKAQGTGTEEESVHGGRGTSVQGGVKRLSDLTPFPAHSRSHRHERPLVLRPAEISGNAKARTESFWSDFRSQRASRGERLRFLLRYQTVDVNPTKRLPFPESSSKPPSSSVSLINRCYCRFRADSPCHIGDASIIRDTFFL